MKCNLASGLASHTLRFCRQNKREALLFGILFGSQVEYLHGKELVIFCHLVGLESIWIRESTRYRVRSVFKIFHFVEQIQKVSNSFGGFMRKEKIAD